MCKYQLEYAVWEMTHGCNMRCQHCGSSCAQPYLDEMTTKECLHVCDELINMGVKFVTLTGGEPTTKKDWYVIAEKLSKAGIYTNIISNGWFVEDDLVEKIKQAGIAICAISIDGVKETHDKIRKEGSFEKDLLALKKLKYHGVQTMVATTINNENIEELKNAIDRVEEVFSNILVCNKGSNILNLSNIRIVNGHTYDYLFDLENYIKDKNLEIKSIVFVDDIINTTRDDIAKCGLDAIENSTSIIFGVNDDYSFGEKTINKVFNSLFNTNFKSILPDIKAISIDLFKRLLEGLKNENNHNNYLITAINENIPIKEKNIKTIWRKKEKRVGKHNFKAIPYLKTLIPYIIKSIIPYFIALVLFVIIFYVRDANNDLKGIIVATTVSEVVGIVIHIAMNYNSIYKNNLISRNILFLLKKIFRIILSCFFIYILYNLLNINLLISKLVVDFILMIVIALIFTTK